MGGNRRDWFPPEGRGITRSQAEGNINEMSEDKKSPAALPSEGWTDGDSLLPVRYWVIRVRIVRRGSGPPERSFWRNSFWL